jgi:hypothetical protein
MIVAAIVIGLYLYANSLIWLACFPIEAKFYRFLIAALPALFIEKLRDWVVS